MGFTADDGVKNMRSRTRVGVRKNWFKLPLRYRAHRSVITDVLTLDLYNRRYLMANGGSFGTVERELRRYHTSEEHAFTLADSYFNNQSIFRFAC